MATEAQLIDSASKAELVQVMERAQSPLMNMGITKRVEPKIGRKLKEIDGEQVRAYARNMAPMTSIAIMMGTSIALLERRFGEIILKEYEHTRDMIRAKQLELAQKGNTDMLKWVGKQYCGQMERIHEESVSAQIVVNVNEVPK